MAYLYVLFDSSSTAPFGGFVGTFSSKEKAVQAMTRYVAEYGKTEYLHVYRCRLNALNFKGWEQVAGYRDGEIWGNERVRAV